MVHKDNKDWRLVMLRRAAARTIVRVVPQQKSVISDNPCAMHGVSDSLCRNSKGGMSRQTPHKKRGPQLLKLRPR
jgi:hypothetical protein